MALDVDRVGQTPVDYIVRRLNYAQQNPATRAGFVTNYQPFSALAAVGTRRIICWQDFHRMGHIANYYPCRNFC